MSARERVRFYPRASPSKSQDQGHHSSARERKQRKERRRLLNDFMTAGRKSGSLSPNEYLNSHAGFVPQGLGWVE